MLVPIHEEPVTEQSTTATRGEAPRGGGLVLGLVRACRPKQWAKNVLVFVAPAAAGVIDEPYVLRLTLVGFVAFCLVSSATYLVNDVLDVESDRRHPTKRSRPIAAGVVPVPVALVAAAVLFGVGVGLALTSNVQLALTVATLRRAHHDLLDRAQGHRGARPGGPLGGVHPPAAGRRLRGRGRGVGLVPAHLAVRLAVHRGSQALRREASSSATRPPSCVRRSVSTAWSTWASCARCRSRRW